MALNISTAPFKAHEIISSEANYQKWLRDELPNMAVNRVFPAEMRPNYRPEPATPIVNERPQSVSFNSTESSFSTQMPSPSRNASAHCYSPPLFNSQLGLNMESSNPTSSPEMMETQRLPTQGLKPTRLFARKFAKK